LKRLQQFLQLFNGLKLSLGVRWVRRKISTTFKSSSNQEQQEFKISAKSSKCSIYRLSLPQKIFNCCFSRFHNRALPKFAVGYNEFVGRVQERRNDYTWHLVVCTLRKTSRFTRTCRTKRSYPI